MTYCHLLWSPNIEIYGFHLADVCSHGSMNTGAPNAQEDTTAAFRSQTKLPTDGNGSYMFQEAQRGSGSEFSTGTRPTSHRNAPLRLQSAQTLFSGLFSSSLSVLACLSVVALSCREPMFRAEMRDT